MKPEHFWAIVGAACFVRSLSRTGALVLAIFSFAGAALYKFIAP